MSDIFSVCFKSNFRNRVFSPNPISWFISDPCQRRASAHISRFAAALLPGRLSGTVPLRARRVIRMTCLIIRETCLAKFARKRWLQSVSLNYPPYVSFDSSHSYGCPLLPAHQDREVFRPSAADEGADRRALQNAVRTFVWTILEWLRRIESFLPNSDASCLLCCVNLCSKD